MDTVSLSPSEVWQFALALTLLLLTISAVAAAAASAFLLALAGFFSEVLPRKMGTGRQPFSVTVPVENAGAR